MSGIFKKGLLLIAVPLVFQMAFVGLLLRNERQNAENELWALHSRQVISQGEAAMRALVQEVNGLRGLVLSGDRAFVGDDVAPVEEKARELVRLVGDNPPQLRRAEEFLRTVKALDAWRAGIEALVGAGRTGDAVERIRSQQGERLLRTAQAQIEGFLAAEQRLDRERVNRLEQASRSQRWFLVGTMAVAAVLAIFLVWAFSQGISSRLEVVTGNARRLAENAALAPPVGGRDEIADLDATLHWTSRRLAAAAEAEQSYKTELEKRAAELAAANDDLRFKTQEIETFVYSVSHDLRSPLVNLQGFSRELEQSCRDLQRTLGKAELAADVRSRLDDIDRDMLESVRYILTAVSRSARIIDALLRLSRAGRVEYQRQMVDVGAVVHRVVDAMRSTIESKGVAVAVGDLPPAWGDPTALEQVFANLLSNAVNYLDPARPGHIEVGGGAASSGAQVTYWVRDNGLGIPAAHQSKLFVAFQRLHGDAAPGEGIGLALIRRVVDRHGGTIRAESREGVGTTFFVTLPAEEGSKIPAGLGPSQEQGAGAREATTWIQ